MKKTLLAGLALIVGTFHSLLAQEKPNNYVVLMNPFSVQKQDRGNFLARWTEVAEYMRRQPGYIDSELHESLEENGGWFNYAKWRSARDFQAAVSSPKFQKLTENFPWEAKPGLYKLIIRVEPAKEDK